MTSIMLRDSGGCREISLQAALIGRRKLTIYGEITMELAQEFVSELLCLTDLDAHQPIQVFVNSGGGSIEAGMLMYDAIQSCPAPVKLYCTGSAFSMAADLLASGQHGRYILPHSRVMIHEPAIGAGFGCNSQSLQTISDALLKTKREMEELLAKHTGKTPEEIAEATREDHYFTAEEAVAFGLVDEIVGFKEIMKAGA